MEDGNMQEDVINISEYIGFLNRRKFSLVLTTLVFIAGGYITTALKPANYKAAVIIRPPAVETAQNLRSMINHQVFYENMTNNITSMNVKADVIRYSGLIRIESGNVTHMDIQDNIEILNRLTDRIAEYYEDKINEAGERIENLLHAIREGKANFEDINIVKDFAEKINNVEIVKGPYYSRYASPGMGLSIAIAGITGVCFGLLIGFIKDKFPKN